MNSETITIGERGGILHVNRQFIALNAKDGGNRPVFTLKPNGPNSTPVYARDLHWDGPTRASGTEGQLSCGARAWMSLFPGTLVILEDPMTYKEAKTV